MQLCELRESNRANAIGCPQTSFYAAKANGSKQNSATIAEERRVGLVVSLGGFGPHDASDKLREDFQQGRAWLGLWRECYRRADQETVWAYGSLSAVADETGDHTRQNVARVHFDSGRSQS